MASPEQILSQAEARGMDPREIAALEALIAEGVDGDTLQVIMFNILSNGLNDPRTQELIRGARVRGNIALRTTAAGGEENLAAIEAALGDDVFNISDAALAELAPTITALREAHGDEPGFINTVREFSGRAPLPLDSAGNVVASTPLDQAGFAAATGNTDFVAPTPDDPAGGGDGSAGFGAPRTRIGTTNDGQRVLLGQDATVWVGDNIVTGSEADRALTEADANRAGVESFQPSPRQEVGSGFQFDPDAPQEFAAPPPGYAIRSALATAGLIFRGNTADGNVIAYDPRADRLAVYGVDDSGQLAFITTDLDAAGGVSGGGGGAAVRLQSLGTDQDGFAVIFNPATGAITRGPQVGFAQIDPRETAAEDARRFNEQQGLREADFIDDVLSGGRNFVTAALLSRGGQTRAGQATQADVIRGGFAVSGLVDALGLGGGGGGQPTETPSTVTSGTAAASGATPTRAQINEGLAGAGRFTFGPATATGGGTEGAGGSGAGQQAGTGLDEFSPDGFTGNPLDDLGGFAVANAPPAVQSIVQGEEVGFLSTPGSTPLASPTTLANLTGGERGALDTTLRLTDQRTFEEFEQESNQRFRPGGFRRAVRA